MSFHFKQFVETIRIKGKKINLNVVATSGKDGEHFVMISPTIMVSGYGNTIEEANESFEHNMVVFCKDILALNQINRDIYLKNLGFERKKFQTKNFSKLYVDENGALQGLEQISNIGLVEATV